MEPVPRHHHSQEVITRMKRASGHLVSVIGMSESQHSCAEVAQQLQAVISALINARKLFVQDHIEQCIQKGLTQPDADISALIRELTQVSKYL